jgi:hypothetical protein
MTQAMYRALARLPPGKHLEQLLATRLAVLVLSAKCENALRQAANCVAESVALSGCQSHCGDLHVLAFKTDMVKIESELRSFAAEDKTLCVKVQRLGSQPFNSCCLLLLQAEALRNQLICLFDRTRCSRKTLFTTADHADNR